MNTVWCPAIRSFDGMPTFTHAASKNLVAEDLGQTWDQTCARLG
ncbi:MAG: hypothetical protein ACI814_005008, partial [Mariniblastus sp.]